MLRTILILLVLILLSGILSASEIALSSSGRGKVKLRAEAGDKRAVRLLAALDKPGRFFATTQLYITFIALFSGAWAADAFTEPLLAWLVRIGVPLSASVLEPLVFFGITAALTYVSLIFGELVPKRIAIQFALPFALRTMGLLHVLSVIAFPFVKLLSATAALVLRLFGIRGDNLQEEMTKEEIRLMVASGGEQGSIDESEQDMIENVFAFNQIAAADICTHRLDVIALPINADFDTIIHTLTEQNYTRIPIYEENLDNICGILHMKDVMHYMAKSPDTTTFDVQTLQREPYFVPLSKKADELLGEMRAERVYMAVVIDEYGGTMGIVTVEDIVEHIMGSIQDEYDTDEQPDIDPLDKQSARIQGAADLESVQDYFDVLLPTEQYDTLSGFLIGQLGYIPTDDDVPEVTFENLLFKVECIQEKRIASVTAVKTAAEVDKDYS